MLKPLIVKSSLISDEGKAPIILQPHNGNPNAIVLTQGQNRLTLNANELDRLFLAVDNEDC